MDLGRFWQLVEDSRSRTGLKEEGSYLETQRRRLAALLSRLPVAEIISFRDHLQDRMIEAYDSSLWVAADLIEEGCSDDGFMDFRGWLISMGRDVYEQALKDPDSLASVARRPDVETTFFEGFASIPDQVYEQLNGQEMPEYAGEHPDAPTGAGLDVSDEELERRFPRLWALFGT